MNTPKSRGHARSAKPQKSSPVAALLIFGVIAAVVLLVAGAYSLYSHSITRFASRSETLRFDEEFASFVGADGAIQNHSYVIHHLSDGENFHQGFGPLEEVSAGYQLIVGATGRVGVMTSGTLADESLFVGSCDNGNDAFIFVLDGCEVPQEWRNCHISSKVSYILPHLYGLRVSQFATLTVEPVDADADGSTTSTKPWYWDGTAYTEMDTNTECFVGIVSTPDCFPNKHSVVHFSPLSLRLFPCHTSTSD